MPIAKKAAKKVVAKKPEPPTKPPKPPRVLDESFVTQEEQGLIACMCGDLKESHGITLRKIRAVVDQLIYESPTASF